MMNTRKLDTVLKVQSIGEAAYHWLSSGQQGKVLASMSRVIYLVTDQGEILWVIEQPGPMHRRCLQIFSKQMPRLMEQSTFRIHNGTLETSSGCSLDFKHSIVWKEGAFSLGTAVDKARLSESVASFSGLFLTRHKPAGFGCLILLILKSLHHQPYPLTAGQCSASALAAWPSVEGILASLQLPGYPSLFEHAMNLVGLGEGLTPSGDDFLGGLFFSLQFMKKTFPDFQNLNPRTYSDFILHCKTLTHPISFTLLQDHANGYTLEPLHCLANGLLAGHPVEQLLPFARELTGVGHSTGWDLLTGFLTGLYAHLIA